MFRIISANVNGIRSAASKGFIEYIQASGADIVCVQELKAQEDKLTDVLKKQVTAAWPFTAKPRLTVFNTVWA